MNTNQIPATQNDSLGLLGHDERACQPHGPWR
jgi:hypothetical protein